MYSFVGKYEDVHVRTFDEKHMAELMAEPYLSNYVCISVFACVSV